MQGLNLSQPGLRHDPHWYRTAVFYEVLVRSREELDNLKIAMTSRAVIDQAKGILMERLKVTEDGAFTVLSHLSQQTNVKLRDLAEQLVTTGVLRNSRH